MLKNFFLDVLQDGTIDGNSAHSKLRLTIPREPDLETAHRAQRIRFIFFFTLFLVLVKISLSKKWFSNLQCSNFRPKTSRERGHGTLTTTFRARPLNKKVSNFVYKKAFFFQVPQVIFLT